MAHEIVRDNRFFPGPFGLITNPFYLARRGLLTAMRNLAPNVTGRVLDIGCGSKPYEKLFDACLYIGMEIAHRGSSLNGTLADVLYDGRLFPFPDGSFHSVICNQVLEHVFEPDLFLGEVSRVLSVGGSLVLSVPFVWDEHEQPVDYGRYSSFGLRHLIEKHDLKLIRLVKATTGIVAVLQLLNGMLYKRYVRSKVFPVKMSYCAVWSATNLLGSGLDLLAANSDDLYLDNVILAVKR